MSGQALLADGQKDQYSTFKDPANGLHGLVQSPYSTKVREKPHRSPLGSVVFLLRLSWGQGAPWFGLCTLFSLINALLQGFQPKVVTTALVQIMASHDHDKLRDTFIIAFLWGLGMGISKAIANYGSIRFISAARLSLSNHLHAIYMDVKGKSYYVLNNLDKKTNNPGSSLTADLDMSLQYTCEFFLGGVMKPETGALCSIFAFCTNAALAWYTVASVNPSAGWIPCTASLVFVALVIPLLIVLSALVSTRLQQIQALEGIFRRQHAQTAIFSESISFYGGESSEEATLLTICASIWATVRSYSLVRIPLDCLLLLMYYAHWWLSTIIAAVLTFYYASNEPAPKRFLLFMIVFGNTLQSLLALVNLFKASLDLIKSTAFSSRVVQVLEVMEEFSEFANPGGSGSTSQVQQLVCGELVPAEASSDIVFRKCSIYTPDGQRLLVKDISLELKQGQSCLIMGPSGIGKSSLLRVLGELWPLFRSPDDHSKQAEFYRPGPRNLFFIAQRPYIFAGTLREQVAYPIWTDSLIIELSDEHMKRLFAEANLSEVWEKRKGDLDETDISWTDVLSLGEQQRLQFCRLFWHYEWHKKYGNGKGFFAVLDESTASLDVESEVAVYSQCKKKGIGFLSVAHRPTVIQFHTKVLHFYFDDKRTLQWEVREGAEFANEAANLVSGSTSVAAPEAEAEAEAKGIAVAKPDSLPDADEDDEGRSSWVKYRGAQKRRSSAGTLQKVTVAAVESPYNGQVHVDPGACCKTTRNTFSLLGLSMTGVTAIYLVLNVVLNAIGAGTIYPWPDIFGKVIVAARDKSPDKPEDVSYLWNWIAVVLVLAISKVIGKGLANLFSIRAMVSARQTLVESIQALYMNPKSKSYYVLNQLDTSLEDVDHRITSDADLLMQYMFECFAGGIIKVDSGVLYNLGEAVACSLSIGLHTKAPFNYITIGSCYAAWALCMLTIAFICRWVERAQRALQSTEGNLVLAHTRITMNSESIAFYGGESSQRGILDASSQDVAQAWKNYSATKFPLDCTQLSFLYACQGISQCFAVYLALSMEVPDDPVKAQQARQGLYGGCSVAFNLILRSLMYMGFSALDYSKVNAFVNRIYPLAAAAEKYHAFTVQQEGKGNGADLPLSCSEMVPAKASPDINFHKVAIFTPNGQRQLVKEVSLELKQGDSCLIMGPSGIGKSSLLRVLGQLWPLFRSPDDRNKDASFSRPGPRNVFFIAQRPYMFSGTLREQVAYPFWEESLKSELTVEILQQLLAEANLSSVWADRKGELDTPGIVWSDVLSLGEQQRLQFARLFWHFQWHQQHGDGRGFFAILDESTASLDTDSEMAVYAQCKQKGMGFLSVAHRPTVIQFHKKVLSFYYDASHELKWKIEDASLLAAQVAKQIRG